jgi:hypothetical protein
MDIEDPKIALLKTCRELGVAIGAYSPLGRGFLTGQYQSPADFEEGDGRVHLPRFSAENFPKNLKLVDKIAELVRKKGCTTGQLTLAVVDGTGKRHYSHSWDEKDQVLGGESGSTGSGINKGRQRRDQEGDCGCRSYWGQVSRSDDGVQFYGHSGQGMKRVL